MRTIPGTLRFEDVIKPGKHACPKCGQTVDWHGPPFKGRMTKLYVFAFHVRHHTLFTKDSRKYPFLRCNCCYYIVTFEEWTNLRIEKEDSNITRVEPHIRPTRAVNQNVGRFMKHGRQAPWYRKTVKTKVNPEEDN